MSFVLPAGVLAVSIDLELDPLRRIADQQHGLEAMTNRLITLFDLYQLPATWAVADPAVSAATDRLTVSGSTHEIAVLGDHSWVGAEAGRSRFAKELHRRVQRARATGLPLTTLVTRDAYPDDHADLLVKQGMTAVLGPIERGKSTLWPQAKVTLPRSLKFGLWEISGTQRLPVESRSWLGGSGYLAAKRGIDRAAADCAVYHVVIDALQLARSGVSGLRVVEKFVRYAVRRREQRKIITETLASLARRLSGVRQSTPARSILRPAA